MAGKARKAAKRTESLIVRVTPEEMRMAQGIAARMGKTVSEWVREQLHNVDKNDAANLWREAISQELIDRHQKGQLADIHLDAEGRIIPSDEAINKVQNRYLKEKILGAGKLSTSTPAVRYITVRTTQVKEEPRIIKVGILAKSIEEPKTKRKKGKEARHAKR